MNFMVPLEAICSIPSQRAATAFTAIALASITSSGRSSFTPARDTATGYPPGRPPGAGTCRLREVWERSASMVATVAAAVKLCAARPGGSA